MRIQAVLPLVLLVLTACGGGKEKEEFERYETTVAPLLQAEGAKFLEFQGVAADAVHYQEESRFGRFIRTEMQPFYAKLAQDVAAVRPEGEKLGQIHALLVQYVDLRRSFFAMQQESEALDRKTAEATKDVRARIEGRMGEVVRAGEAIQPLFEAAPETGRRIGETLRQIGAAAEEYQKLLQGLEAGGVASSQYLNAVDQRFLPFFAQARKALSTLEPDTKGQLLLDAVLAYIAAFETMIAESRPLAEARAGVEKEIEPIRRRIGSLLDEAAKTLAAYKQEAGAYRDSLR